MIADLGRIFRNLIRTSFWVLVSCVAIALNFGVAGANYMGAVNAFDLLKYEPTPISQDPVFGSIVGAFFGRATLAHFFAFTLAATLAFTVFLISHIAVQTYHLHLDRRVYRANNDNESEVIATEKLRFCCASIVLLLVPLCYAFRWDLFLFRYRSLAVALYQDPMAAVGEMKAWGAGVAGTLAVVDGTGIGAWGYLSVTILACVGLELALHWLGDAFAMLNSSIATLFPSESQVEDSADAEPPQPSAEATPQKDPPTKAAAPDTRAAAADLLDDHAPNADANASRAVTSAADARVPVIGRTGLTTTLADALSDPARYHVEPATGEVFDRAFWQQLQGETANT